MKSCRFVPDHVKGRWILFIHLRTPYFGICINKKGYMITLPRLSSQTINEFDFFIIDLEKPAVDIPSLNPNFVLMTIDVHNKPRNWSIDNPTTSEGAQLDSLMDL